MKKKNKKRLSREKQAQIKKRRKNIITVILCILVVCIGYIGADAYMIRHDEPALRSNSSSDNSSSGKSSLNVSDCALEVPSLSLDNSVMLSSVMNDAKNDNFKSLAFELKREDGSVGYTSSLSAVNSYGASSLPASQLHESLKTMSSRGFKSIGVIYCLKDNIAPQNAPETAVKNAAELYKDSDGNYYLNPNNEEAMRYLKEIVSEAYNLGVRTFVLCSTTLPDDIKASYNSSFSSISSQLKDSAGDDALFIEGVEETVNGYNAENGEYDTKSLNKEVKELPRLKKNQIYVIHTTRDSADVHKALNKYNKTGYIIAEEE